MVPEPIVKYDFPLTGLYSNSGVDKKLRLVVPAPFMRIFKSRQDKEKKNEIRAYYRVEDEKGPNRLYLTDYLKSEGGLDVLEGFKFPKLDGEGRILLEHGIFEVAMRNGGDLTFLGMGHGILIGPRKLKIEELVKGYDPKIYHP